MSPGHVLGFAFLGLMLLAAVGTVLGGLGLLTAHSFGRDDDGFYSARLDDFVSSGAAIRSDDLDLNGDPGPEWVLDRVDATVRIEAESVAPGGEVFIGIADIAELDAYLDGVAHEVVTDVDNRTPKFDSQPGGPAPAPAEKAFWVASAAGSGSQRLEWKVESGDWTAVLMNSDGSVGIAHRVEVGIDTTVLLPIGLALLGAGLLGVLVTIPLIALLTRSSRRRSHPGESDVVVATPARRHPQPVHLVARLDTPLSPWLWLVKWFLAIPHFVVLAFLWVGFVVASVAAFFSILFTGRYPQALFRYTSGVLRWTWRVSFYATTGGLGTDRYPPFSLGEVDDYPATLTIAEPGTLSRGKVLVKWWLLAIPHYIVVAFIAGWGAAGAANENGAWLPFGSLLGALTVIAGCFMLFGRRYPQGLFDLIIGLNRWVYRVLVYVALMTDEYPPFRLDQGGSDVGPSSAPFGDDDPGLVDLVDPSIGSDTQTEPVTI